MKRQCRLGAFVGRQAVDDEQSLVGSERERERARESLKRKKSRKTKYLYIKDCLVDGLEHCQPYTA